MSQRRQVRRRDYASLWPRRPTDRRPEPTIPSPLAADKERRQAARDNEGDPAENIAAVLADQAARRAALAAEAAALREGATGALKAGAGAAAGLRARRAVDDLFVRLTVLDSDASRSAYFMPPFEQRALAAASAALRADLEETRTAVAPRKTFAFRQGAVRKTTVAGESEAAAAAAEAERVAEAASASRVAAEERAGREAAVAAARAEGRAIVGLRDAVVVLRPGEGGWPGGAAGSSDTPPDIHLADLERCSVWILGPLASLRVWCLRDCRVVAGPVLGSTFLEGAENVQLWVATRQLRCHEAKGCDLALRLTSRPVVETCERVRVAPLGDAARALGGGAGQEEALRAAGLADETGRWRDVDDFGWIKASEQSPNWSVLPESERIEAPASPEVAEAVAGGGGH